MPQTPEHILRLCHLYPSEMNTYADSGNIATLKNRLKWRAMGLEVTGLGLEDTLTTEIASQIDLIYMGGGQDIDQKNVADDLMTKAEALQEILLGSDAHPVVGLFVCGGYQLAGHSYKTPANNTHNTKDTGNNTIKGLDVLGVETTQPEARQRLVGQIRITADIEGKELEILGYENHAGQTYIIDDNTTQPLGKVISGYGNNKTEDREGAMRNRTIGTYIHGPLLPNNPALADLLIRWGLEHRYGSCPELPDLDDTFAELARENFRSK